MQVVGHIKELWRFPVKSMQGSTLQECTVSAQGLLGDRAWAMRDEGRQEIQWGKMYPQLMLCAARYRHEPTPNFFIDTASGQAGLAEQAWVGKTLAIGGARLEISAPTPRCGMTVRPQGDLTFDKSILRTIVREGNQNLGVGAHVRQAGRVRVGDEVLIA